MKVGISIGGSGTRASSNWSEAVDYVCEAERLGADFAWSAEAWGQDAVTPLAFLAARTSRIALGHQWLKLYCHYCLVLVCN